jgi:hypothetical protein
MKQYRALSVAVGLFVASAAASAQAQIDSDPPLLAGQKSYHLYSVAGLINNGMATVILCSNTSSENVLVGVEVFGAAGGASINDASLSAVTVPPSGSVMYAAQELAAFSGEINLAVGVIHMGAARVLATSRGGLACTAFLVTHTNPVTATTALTIIKKTKQKGD